MLHETGLTAAHYAYSDTKSLDAAISAYLSAAMLEDVQDLDATDMDMIRRGDMLGPVLGARVATLIQSQAVRIAELEAVAADLATDLEAELNARYGMDPVHPAEARRKERDMEPVQRARDLLNGERKG